MNTPITINSTAASNGTVMIAILVMPKMSILIFEPITAIAIIAITARTKVEITFILFFMIYSAIEVLLLSVSAVGRAGALFLFPRRLASGATGGVGLTFRSGAGAGIGSSVFAALKPPSI